MHINKPPASDSEPKAAICGNLKTASLSLRVGDPAGGPGGGDPLRDTLRRSALAKVDASPLSDASSRECTLALRLPRFNV